MKYGNGRVEDIDLAWEMATAEDPYRELAALAAKHGLTKIVKEMHAHANHVSHLAETRYKDEIRSKRIREIEETTQTPILYKENIGSKRGYRQAWEKLITKIGKEPDIPLKAIQIIDDEYAITGDFQTAAWGLQNSTAGYFLRDAADRFARESELD